MLQFLHGVNTPHYLGMDRIENTILLMYQLLHAQPSARTAQKTPLSSQSIGAC
jgi:hypothetical protein